MIKIAFCVVFATVCFSCSVFALNAGNSTLHTEHRLKVVFDNTLKYKLFEIPELVRAGQVYDYEYNWDSVKKLRIYHWNKLPQGIYTLHIRTAFGAYETDVLDIKNDTTVFVKNTFELVSTSNLRKADFMNADSIQLFYNTSGCFHNYNEKAVLYRLTGNSYRLTFSYDSTGVQERPELIATPVLQYQAPLVSRIYTIPMLKHYDVNADAAGRIFELVRKSQLQMDTVRMQGRKCYSTTSQTLFVLVNNSLFQFSDYDICNWDFYRNFRRGFR